MQIHKQRQSVWKSSWKEFWKLQVNKTNFGRCICVFLVKYIYIWLKFRIFEILLGNQNKTFKKLSKMLFILPKKFLLLSIFSNFCTSLFHLFSFLSHCWFYGGLLMINTKIYDINMSLNWILKTQIPQDLVK